VLVRFPARLVLAGSVLGVFAASSATVYSLSEDVDDAAVTVVYDASSDEAPAEPAPPVPTVTGAQLAALAVTPARDRAAALIAEREAAERARLEDEDDDRERSPEERIRAALQDACDDGRIRGVICRNI
jgi:hypothetical protein